MDTQPAEDDLDAPIAPGDLLGRWVLGEALGRGASATVFAARHADLGRAAALKVLHHGAAFSPDARARFLREGRAAAAVAHPNAVAVYDVAVHQGIPYLVMERVGGETLGSLLRAEGPLDVPRAVDLLLSVADALAAAHDAGVVHRDVKPANIAVVREDGGERPALLDFGAARLLAEADGDLTRSRAVLGTPAYMAPEQALAARAATPASDQFALAAVLLEATSGALPYAGARWTECFAAAVRGEVQEVSKVAPGLPAGLARALSRALDPSPEARFATMRDLARALWPHASPAARARWSAYATADPVRRRWGWWWAIAAAGVMVGGGVWRAASTSVPSSAGAADGGGVSETHGTDASPVASVADARRSVSHDAGPPPPSATPAEEGTGVEAAPPRVARPVRRRAPVARVDAGAPEASGPNEAPIFSH